MNRYSISPLLRTVTNNIRTRGTLYTSPPKYPLIPQSNNDIYVRTGWGDRFDNLAYQFYGDITLWWIISAANPNIVDFSSIFIPIGTEMRIPQNIGAIVDSYNALNR
tara:strand:+ start:257 stop:577 length:321 start_codon:yes stop_codon:yes gene_type:complete